MDIDYEIDTIVIGAGVVGLAAARALANTGDDVLVIEKNGLIGEETSARNSEVIHAGIYYLKGTQKGSFCVKGRPMLYDYCSSRNIPHRKCGKLIVATKTEEEATLSTLYKRGLTNGMNENDLIHISGTDAIKQEPNLHATAALWSPETGIIDSHTLMLNYRGDIEDKGGAIALNSPVLGGEVTTDGIILQIGGAEPALIKARKVINSAGFWAQDVARSIIGIPQTHIPPRVLYKGNYYSLVGKSPFSTLIYPAPMHGGLGVHLTIDIVGNARFGPDVEILSSNNPADIDYTVDPKRSEVFYDAIRKYWPDLKDGTLAPAYAGVRPKIDPNYDHDYMIEGPEHHGVDGLVNLFGMESPALTSSLAIGDYVVDLLTS